MHLHIAFNFRIGRAGRYGSSGICITIASSGQELESFQNILGTIGGTELVVPKLPTGELSNEILNSGTTNFEVVHGTPAETESVMNALKEAILDQKPTKRKARDDEGVALQLERLSFVEVTTDLVSHIGNVLDISKQDFQDKFVEQSAGVLLQDLVSGKVIETSDTDKRAVRENNLDFVSHFQDFRKDDAIQCRAKSVDTSHATVTNIIVQKNVALLNLAQLLTQDLLFKDQIITNNVVVAIGSYLGEKKQADATLHTEMEEKFSCSTATNILENICECSELWQSGFGISDDFEHIFSHSYNYATEKSHRHWSDTIHVDVDKELENVDPPPQNASKNLLCCDDDDEEDQEEEDMLEQDVQPPSYIAETSHLEWVPVSDTVQGYTNPEYDHNEMYASYFNYYGDVLANDVLTFENVATFDSYFAQWQAQVAAVREYVQQNIYLQEMNTYHYYGS